MARRPLLAAAVFGLVCVSCSSTTSTAPSTSSTPSSTSSTTSTSTTSTTSATAPSTTTSTTTTALPKGPALPAPTGPDAVGVAPTSVAGAVVYFPAVAGTGSGHLPYIAHPEWATLAGLDPALFAPVTPHALVGAAPKPTATPRPVLVLQPGWRSLIAFSTSLAEDLASHGYVVIAAQSDIVTEAPQRRTTPAQRLARANLFRRLLTLVATPELAALAGPVDTTRVAIGGHSYAGSIALDLAVTDRRIAAVVDIDGGAKADATRPVANRPTLLLATVDESVEPDVDLGGFAARSPNSVSVGVTQALHMDLTDAPLWPELFGASVFTPLIGRGGARGPASTAVIVGRFLDAALSTAPHVPDAASLVSGLDGTTTDPYSA